MNMLRCLVGGGRVPLWLVLVGFGLVGCQSYEEGVTVLCEGYQRCDDCRKAPPDMRLTLLAAYFKDTVSNGEAEALFDSMAAQRPEERAETLRGEAKKVGLASCPLADTMAGAEGSP